MKNLHQTLQTAANIAIIVVAVVLAGVFFTRYFGPASAPPPVAAAGSREIEEGAKVQLADIDRRGSDKTLVMVLSTTCRYCTASIPFYQKLAQQRSERAGLKLVAVMPQGIQESREYLSKHGIPVDEVRQAALDEVNVSGTPTLIEVDRSGTVVRSWVGKLPPEKESEVINSVFGPSN
jgi:thioredoxin-related protein